MKLDLVWTKLATIAVATAVAGCGGSGGDGSSTAAPFALAFAATANGRAVGCGDVVTGVGPDGHSEVRISDLRFYVSNLRFLAADGSPVALTLDESDFQLDVASGFVGLVDLTSNTESSCANDAIAFAEGTARTNFAITGTTDVDRVATVAFDVGVPQAVMQQVIAENTLEGAPSPLGEMYWSWATGYRHLVVNMTVRSANGGSGEGYLHVGSRGCGPEGGRALEDRDSCSFVNTPTVEIPGFDLAADTVQIDLTELLRGIDFVSPVRDTETSEIIGETTGIECHSAPPAVQPDCAPLFANLGLSPLDGRASAAANRVFSRMQGRR